MITLWKYFGSKILTRTTSYEQWQQEPLAMNRNNILALTDADVNGIDDSNLYESRLKLKPQLTRPAATRVVITHLFAQCIRRTKLYSFVTFAALVLLRRLLVLTLSYNPSPPKSLGRVALQHFRNGRVQAGGGERSHSGANQRELFSGVEAAPGFIRLYLQLSLVREGGGRLQAKGSRVPDVRLRRRYSLIVKLGLHQRLRAVGQRFDKSNADLKARPLALTVERATYFIYPYLLSFKDRIVKTPFSREAYSSLSGQALVSPCQAHVTSNTSAHLSLIDLIGSASREDLSITTMAHAVFYSFYADCNLVDGL
ncbi:uncharacterized protein F5891DRAFT_982925 [Suillus fuscotomentosus]|uniref:Uncharacterized protein n=1 Tax=Suillus fuscotomentosus TaxID=1912939 RepID=A0AAD4E061_9AGAM|nr:uncharacterized protein F5891DRAFT_982925 [Suillus fuscotomentosus]KAG1897125.1 hypothetical protein F5891DRAFT_982925 [Suillus fuscotomentosus]